MTTFQGISTSKRSNRSFWNAHISFLIASVREHQRLNNEKSQAFIRSYKCSIEKALESRANFEYLNK
jgi:hypothetical protein